MRSRLLVAVVALGAALAAAGCHCCRRPAPPTVATAPPGCATCGPGGVVGVPPPPAPVPPSTGAFPPPGNGSGGFGH
jgi:hypothetical protein